MRPASSFSATLLSRLLSLLLLAAPTQANSEANPDPGSNSGSNAGATANATATIETDEQEAQSRFVRLSFARLIEELGFAKGDADDSHGLAPLDSRLLCDQMCERFLRGGLTPEVECHSECAELTNTPAALLPPRSTQRGPRSRSAEGRAASSDSDVSRDSSDSVDPSTRSETPRP